MKNTNGSPSIAVQLLDALERAGEKGMSFGEMQEFAFRLSRPASKTPHPRGWWCTALVGNGYFGSHHGLLYTFAERTNDGRWRRNNVKHEGHPWTKVTAGGRFPAAYRVLGEAARLSAGEYHSLSEEGFVALARRAYKAAAKKDRL